MDFEEEIFLADNNIPFAYSDTISISELFYLFNTLTEYLKASPINPV